MSWTFWETVSSSSTVHWSWCSRITTWAKRTFFSVLIHWTGSTCSPTTWRAIIFADTIWVSKLAPFGVLPPAILNLKTKFNRILSNSLEQNQTKIALRFAAHFLNNIAFDLDEPPTDLKQLRWITDAELSEFLAPYLSRLTELRGEQTVDLIKEVKFFRLFSSYLSILVSFLTILTSEPIESNLVSLFNSF